MHETNIEIIAKIDEEIMVQSKTTKQIEFFYSPEDSLNFIRLTSPQVGKIEEIQIDIFNIPGGHN